MGYLHVPGVRVRQSSVRVRLYAVHSRADCLLRTRSSRGVVVKFRPHKCMLKNDDALSNYFFFLKTYFCEIVDGIQR